MIAIVVFIDVQSKAFYSAMVFFYLYGISCTESVYFVLIRNPLLNTWDIQMALLMGEYRSNQPLHNLRSYHELFIQVI